MMLFVISIVILTACGVTSEQDDLFMLQPIHYTETIGNLSYDIQIAKNQFSLDEEIEVTSKVTNVSDEIVHLYGSTSCPHAFTIDIENQQSTMSEEPREKENFFPKSTSLVWRSKVCTADLGGRDLDPGNTFEDKVYFVTKQRIHSELMPAKLGKYNVTVYYPSKSPEGDIIAEVNLVQAESTTEEELTEQSNTEITADDLDEIVAFQDEVGKVVIEELAKQYVGDESMNDFIWYWDNDNRKIVFIVYREDSPKWIKTRKQLEDRLSDKIVIRKAKKDHKRLQEVSDAIMPWLISEYAVKNGSSSYDPITEKVTVEIYEYTEEIADAIKAKFGSEDIEVVKMGMPQ